MSTQYFLEKPLTLDTFLSGLPEGVANNPTRGRVEHDGKLYAKGSIHGTDLSGGSAYLCWYACDGVLHHLERYGSNRPRRMLEALAAAFETQIRDELGAVLGVDDWFDFYSQEESYDAVPRHQANPEPSPPAG